MPYEREDRSPRDVRDWFLEKFGIKIIIKEQGARDGRWIVGAYPDDIRSGKAPGRYMWADNGEPVDRYSYPCFECGLIQQEGPWYEDYPDACLGWIEGVEFACCGHGTFRRAYVRFLEQQDEPTIRNEAAVKWFNDRGLGWRP